MFLDLETGGFNCTKHGICQVGFIVFDTDSYEIVSKSEIKVKPYFINLQSNEICQYTEEAFEVNRHNELDLKEHGFTIENVLSVLESVINRYEIVFFGGHNIKNFDIKFLESVYQLYLNKPFKYDALVCTMNMAKNRLNLKSNSLINICKHFELEPKNYHTAMADAEASFEVFRLMRLMPMIK